MAEKSPSVEDQQDDDRDGHDRSDRHVPQRKHRTGQQTVPSPCLLKNKADRANEPGGSEKDERNSHPERIQPEGRDDSAPRPGLLGSEILPRRKNMGTVK